MVTEVGCCRWIGVKLLYTLVVVNDRCNSHRILLPLGVLTDERPIFGNVDEIYRIEFTEQ